MKKKVIITGGTKGIGRACSAHFASEGYDVVMTYHQDHENAEDVVQILGQKFPISISCVRADSAEKSDILAVCTAHSDATTLINNVGSVSYLGSFERSDMFNYHLMGTVHATEIFVETCNHGSSIVNISSILGQDPFSWYKAMRLESYSCMKAAVDMYTKISSKKYNGNIRVNAVSPGNTRTSSWEGADEGFIFQRERNSCIGRFVTAKEIASTVYGLATNTGINGQIVQVDGGSVARGYEPK